MSLSSVNYTHPQPNMMDLLNQAFSLHQQKQFEQAEKLYQQVLEIQPQNVNCLNMLAGMYMESSQYTSALEIIQKTIANDPNKPMLYFNQGLVLEKLSQESSAISSYQKALALDPKNLSVLKHLLAILQKEKRYEEGLLIANTLLELEPDNERSHYNRGLFLSLLEKFELAIEAYTQAILRKPDFAIAYANRAFSYGRCKDYENALKDYETTTQLSPNDAHAYRNKGLILQNMQRNNEAIENYQKAITLQPDLTEAYYGIALLADEIGDKNTALINYKEAIRLNPNYVEAHNGLGNVLGGLQKIEESIACFNKALEIRPDYPEAYNNRGVVYQESGNITEALKDFNNAISLKPDYAKAYWNSSNNYLLIGDLKNGWERFEWRKIAYPTERDKDTRNPQWIGKENLNGKTILLYSEQGFGDTLQFCRYVPMVKALGAKVILETEPALLTILSTLPHMKWGDEDTLTAKTTDYIQADYQAPLISLPLAFQTFSGENIPKNIPYLFAQTDKQAFWQNHLGKERKSRVGLVWSGNSAFKSNTRRNVPFELIAKLNHPDIDFYSLQKGSIESEVRQLKEKHWQGDNFYILTEYIHDFSDTSAFLEQLDLLISVDTSVVHLAGAMGKETWLLNRFDTCWRWGINQENSPWYPSIKIFRQPKIADWESVMEKVKIELWGEWA